MKHFILSIMALAFWSFHATGQNPLSVSLNLSNGPTGGPEGVAVTFAVQAGGAVLSEVVPTDANGLASTVFDVPPGTMQGLVFATYFDCDSVEAIITSSFSVNALGGLQPVDMFGTWCSGGGVDCDPVLTGNVTFAGPWLFEVNGAGDDATFVWSIDGAAISDNYASEFMWSFAEGNVYTVCVTAVSATCGTWDDCMTVDLSGGNNTECSISYVAYQTMDSDSNLVANSVDVFVAEFDSNAQYFWDFGDEGTSNEALPTHVYAGNGPYVLCVTATWATPVGTMCTATYCDTLELDEDGFLGFTEGFVLNVYAANTGTNGVVESARTSGVTLYPNPIASGSLLQWSTEVAWDWIAVHDARGRALMVWNGTEVQRGSCSLGDLARGTYFVQFATQSGKSYTERLIVQ